MEVIFEKKSNHVLYQINDTMSTDTSFKKYVRVRKYIDFLEESISSHC